MQDTASVYYKYTSVTISTANGITDVYPNVIVLYSYCSSCSSCSKFTVVTEIKSLYMISKQFVNSTAVSVCTHVFYLVSPTRNILVLPKIPSIPQWVWFSISSTFNPFSSCFFLFTTTQFTQLCTIKWTKVCGQLRSQFTVLPV